jgi:hypothetical protein
VSQMWHRMRGLANPTPALEQGGVEQNAWDPSGDVLLPDDHFARIHNPPNGRVPPQLPAAVTRPRWPDFPMQQYARFFRVTPAALDEQLGFQAQSVRVDNYSSHWVFVRSSGIYIPPFIYGTVISLQPGASVAEYTLGGPVGHADAATNESLVVSMWYECELIPVTGFSVPST